MQENARFTSRRGHCRGRSIVATPGRRTTTRRPAIDAVRCGHVTRPCQPCPPPASFPRRQWRRTGDPLVHAREICGIGQRARSAPTECRADWSRQGRRGVRQGLGERGRLRCAGPCLGAGGTVVRAVLDRQRACLVARRGLPVCGCGCSPCAPKPARRPRRAGDDAGVYARCRCGSSTRPRLGCRSVGDRITNRSESSGEPLRWPTPSRAGASSRAGCRVFHGEHGAHGPEASNSGGSVPIARTEARVAGGAPRPLAADWPIQVGPAWRPPAACLMVRLCPLPAKARHGDRPGHVPNAGRRTRRLPTGRPHRSRGEFHVERERGTGPRRVPRETRYVTPPR